METYAAQTLPINVKLYVTTYSMKLLGDKHAGQAKRFASMLCSTSILFTHNHHDMLRCCFRVFSVESSPCCVLIEYMGLVRNVWCAQNQSQEGLPRKRELRYHQIQLYDSM